MKPNENNDVFGFDVTPGILDAYEPDTIDNLDEAADVLSGIGAGAEASAANEAVQSLSDMADALQPVVYVARETVRRVRLLTWAVVAIVVYLVLMEVKD